MKPIDGTRESRGGRGDSQVPLYKHRRHKCNGCATIFDCVPCPHTQRREEVFCSPECEEKSKEAPRDQFDQYTQPNLTFRQAGGGRNTGKGRR